jgi:hypothetical protein
VQEVQAEEEPPLLAGLVPDVANNENSLSTLDELQCGHFIFSEKFLTRISNFF